MVMSIAGVINASSNEAKIQNKVGSDTVVTRVIPIVPLERVWNDEHLKGYFCSGVVFNLSHKVLSNLEIEVLGKGSGVSLTPSFINESDFSCTIIY